MVRFIKSLLGRKGKEILDLSATSSGDELSEELAVAVGAVMLEIAGRDGDYAPEEVNQIVRIMESALSLEAEEARALLRLADDERQDKDKFTQMIRLLNQEYNTKQRIKLMSLLWKIMYADGAMDKTELRFMEQMRNRFQLSPDDLEHSRILSQDTEV